MKNILFIFVLWMAGLPAQAESFNHAPWDMLLKKHVISIEQGVATQVDYDGFLGDRFQLKVYLSTLQAVPESTFEGWSKAEQLAFLINAYNAWTVELILARYPDLESIKDLGSWLTSPWAKSFVPLLGETRSLDEIEHEMIRAEGQYEEPRIHFAVNCASIGCPALALSAYTGEHLNDQLEDATRLFLSDRSRNRLTGNTLNVSKLFDWYREDFERGWGGYKTLPQFLSNYSKALGLSKRDIQHLKSGDIVIDFLDYDWRLNRKP